MKDMDRILIGAAVLLVLAAVVLVALPQPDVGGPEDPAVARELFKKTVGLAKGQQDYYYSYAEVSDGFRSEYALLKRGNESMIEVDTMLASKQAYFLENDTVLCIHYMGLDRCSSVQNETDLKNYLDSLRLLFFDDERMEQTESDMLYFETNGLLFFSTETVEKSVGGHACTEFSYSFDFTNISLYDASRFGIGTSTPKQFRWVMCADNATGEVYEKHVTYSQNGVDHENEFTLLSSEWGTARAISAPENLSEGAVELLMEEKLRQNTLSGCYQKSGDERDRCVALLALDLRNRDMCGLAGGRKDRCLVSLVPFLREAGICTEISDQSFRDDCYIEMGGATGDESYCGMISEQEKKDYCANVSSGGGSAKPQVPQPAIEEVAHTNESIEDKDVQDFLSGIYAGKQNDTNVTE